MLNELFDLAFLGVGGGMLLCGISWLLGLAVSLACNILKSIT